MGKIVYVMGKSASGKDTIYRQLKERTGFRCFVPYTTRPIRDGETEGVDYHYVSESEYERFEAAGKCIEARAYMTIHGKWIYFSADDGQIDLEKADYITVGTLESYVKMQAYFGKDNLLPVYVEVEDGERLQRALGRERQQENPKYEEMCRRFLADCKDFSEEKILAAGIGRRFRNDSLEACTAEIEAYIRAFCTEPL